MKKRFFQSLLFIVFVVAFFLRFYLLSSIPSGLEQDETSIGYNAYSVLQTGKDEYGKSYPLSFKAFGEYKLPGYIYATVLSIKIFGFNEFAVRFISALSGSLTVVLVYFLLTALLKKKSLFALATSALLAINPWHLHLSRGGFEVSLGLFLIVLGIYLWVIGIEKKNKFLLFPATIFLFASVYTYNIARFFIPLLFLYLIVQNRKYLFQIKRTTIILLVFSAVLLIPFGLEIFSSSGISAVKGTLITSSAVVQAPFIEMRSYMNNVFPSFAVKLLFNMPILTVWHYFNNIVSYLSVDYLFVSGSTHGNHGIGTSGQFYFFELLFIVLGLIEIIRRKYTWGYLFIFWTIFVILIASLTREVPQATRSFFMVIPFEVFSGLGFVSLISFIRQQKKLYLSQLLFGCLTLFIALSCFYYFASYYVRFPLAYAKQWREEDKYLSLYLSLHEKEYDKVIFDTHAGFVYTSFLFYTHYSPQLFQQTVKRAPDDGEGFSSVIAFGKYEFKDIDWVRDYQPRTLIITTTERKPNDVPPLASFAYPQRPIAFAVKQEVVSYQIQDFAYVLVAKK